MKKLLSVLLLCLPLAAQTLVLPPISATEEGYAGDGDVWTYRNGRASSRYPASWIGNPRIIHQVAWRADATYAYTFDRPSTGPQTPCNLTLRVGMWNGAQTTTWSPNLTTAFQGQLDPPQMVVTQAWVPQPFTFVIPLTSPVAIVQMGVEIDVAFQGPWDPTWGNRCTYWVDSAMGQQPTLADLWLDPTPPYMGCGGWISETRLDRVFGQLTMEARATGLPNAPAILALGATILYTGCAHINGVQFLPAVTDAGGWLQIGFPQPTADLLFTWQMWIYDAARPADQCFGSGHACGWRQNSPWPTQLLYAYDDQSPAPAYVSNGLAWVVELR